MTRRWTRHLPTAIALAIISAGCSTSSLTSMASKSLFNEMGGMDSMSKLSNGLLSSSARDGRLSGLMGKADVAKVQPKLSNQLCSMLGGGCAAPLTEQQIADGAKRVTPEQSKALTENLGSSLGRMDLPSALTDSVKKAVAPKLGGIMGALL